MPRLKFTDAAERQLLALERDASQHKRLKAVRAALGKMEVNLRHPGLKTHDLKTEKCPHGEKLFEAYAQNRTPGAYRIFWCYEPPPPPGILLIVAINTGDVSWGNFVNMLKYKGDLYGKHVFEIDPKNTSKMCSNCHEINTELELKDREWQCKHCKTYHDRDINAALNVLRIGQGLPEYQALEAA